MTPMYYASAWALFSFLVNERSGDLLRYMQRLVELPEEAQPGAWPEVFPDLSSAAQLDEALRRWLAHGRHIVAHYTVAFTDSPVTTRALGDGDVLAARALLRQHFAPTAPETQLAIDAALAAEPTNLLATSLQYSRTKSLTADAAHALTTAHPDDWRAWLLLSSVILTGPEAWPARDKVCALMAEDHTRFAPTGLCTRRAH